MSLFVIVVWSNFGIFLVFPLSPVHSDLFPLVVSFVDFLFLFQYILACFVCLSIFACCRFLICFQPNFPSRFWVSVRALSRNTYHYYYLLLVSFSHQRELMVFYWSLSDTKSPQVSRTLSILTILIDVWMVSNHPLISKSSAPFNNPLVVLPRAPITIDIRVTFMSHSFFQFSNKVKVFILLFTFFQFYSMVNRDRKVLNFASSLFFSFFFFLFL